MRLLVFWCIFFSATISAAGSDTQADIRVADVNGEWHTPFASNGKKPVVLIFVMHDCPIANAFAPEIGRICEEYAAKGASLYMVHVDPALSAEDAAKHATDYGFKCPVLLDRTHALVKAAQATVTPEAAVFAADGSLKYRGRINDQYVDIGKKRIHVTKHDLREALDAVLNGKAVANATTQAVGCYISDLKGATK